VVVGMSMRAHEARACAPAPPLGERVSISDEQALIVWDAAHATEHFIRRARFATQAKDFGFLVPTPSRPSLAEAPDALFQRLADATKPEETVDDGFRVQPGLACLSLMRGGALKSAPETAAAPHVALLAVEHVAGYDAAILAADDASALSTWLTEHGYPSTPSLEGWLRPYVEAKWIVTAFKIARAAPGDVGSSAVRMTFATERPFYPYREPADQREGNAPGRILDVYLIAPDRVEGTLDGKPWSVTTYFAKESNVGALLASVVPDAPARAWLHRFIDTSSPRPGTADLFFAKSNAAPIVPPPIVHDRRRSIWLPIDLALVPIVALVYALRRSRRAASPM
jgi:hypothetical protein